jgi:hypothetical protein
MCAVTVDAVQARSLCDRIGIHRGAAGGVRRVLAVAESDYECLRLLFLVRRVLALLIIIVIVKLHLIRLFIVFVSTVPRRRIIIVF